MTTNEIRYLIAMGHQDPRLIEMLMDRPDRNEPLQIDTKLEAFGDAYVQRFAGPRMEAAGDIVIAYYNLSAELREFLKDMYDEALETLQ